MLALKQRGEPTGDADILIGASALVHGLIVMSNDEDHFRWIRGLDTDNGLGS
jgi:predicted nucleic acid-binding protein